MTVDVFFIGFLSSIRLMSLRTFEVESLLLIPYIPRKNKQKKNLQRLCELGSKTNTDLVLSVRVKFQFLGELSH